MTTSSRSTVKYLYDLDYGVFQKLCDVLKEDDTWERLAGYLGYRADINYLRQRPNPPEELFVKWFAKNGTINYLFILLAKLNHQRAMQILKDYTSSDYHCLLKENDVHGLGKSMFIPSESKQVMPSMRLHQDPSMPSTSRQFANQNGSVSAGTPTPQMPEHSNKKFVPDPSNINEPRTPASNQMKNFHQTPKYNEQKATPPDKDLPPGACGGNETVESITDNCAWLPNDNLYKNKKPDLTPLNIKSSIPPSMVPASDVEAASLKKEMNNNKLPLDNKSLESLLPSVVKVSYSELIEATGGFKESNILGQGGFGIVYKGTWKGTKVAVKRLHPREGRDDKQKQMVSFKQSLNEMSILSRFRIDNILPLYGVCLNDKEPCLLYMYMANGSLEDRLLLKNKTPPLTWGQRRQIAEGTAKGLNYLHTIADTPLVHGDIKSANILLDANMEPKIGDFGLAREGPSTDYTHVVVTSIHGTEPYLPPEYLRQRKLSPKVDVYSYGVVLFEICTGLRAKLEKNKFLVSHVQEHANNNTLHLLRDAKAGEEGSIWFDHMLGIGLKCADRLKKLRPEMSEVSKKFEELKQASAPEDIMRRKLSLETPPFSGDTQELSPIELQLRYDMKNLQIVRQQQPSLSRLMREVEEVRPPPEMPSYFKWPHAAATSMPTTSSFPQNLLTGVREPPSSIRNGQLSITEGPDGTDSILSTSSVAATFGNTQTEMSINQVSPETSERLDSNASYQGLDISGPCGPVPRLSGLIGPHASMSPFDGADDGPINISIGSNFTSIETSSSTSAKNIGSN